MPPNPVGELSDSGGSAPRLPPNKYAVVTSAAGVQRLAWHCKRLWA